jgi:hypothetical protein
MERSDPGVTLGAIRHFPAWTEVKRGQSKSGLPVSKPTLNLGTPKYETGIPTILPNDRSGKVMNARYMFPYVSLHICLQPTLNMASFNYRKDSVTEYDELPSSESNHN